MKKSQSVLSIAEGISVIFTTYKRVCVLHPSLHVRHIGPRKESCALGGLFFLSLTLGKSIRA